VAGKQREAERAGAEHEHERSGNAGAGNPPLRIARGDPGKHHGEECDDDRHAKRRQAHAGTSAISFATHRSPITGQREGFSSRREFRRGRRRGARKPRERQVAWPNSVLDR
jgi:hypothetical protein